MVKSWLDAYKELIDDMRIHPNWKLIEYNRFVPTGPILDLGMGNGRNALFFAKMGYDVDCIDISRTHVRKCRKLAESENLNLNARVADMRDFDIQASHYSLIVASKVLHYFQKSEIESYLKLLDF